MREHNEDASTPFEGWNRRQYPRAAERTLSGDSSLLIPKQTHVAGSLELNCVLPTQFAVQSGNETFTFRVTWLMLMKHPFCFGEPRTTTYESSRFGG
jgi:hypothetical protein